MATATQAVTQGFAALTATLKKQNSTQAQNQRFTAKMMQAGDNKLVMWARRTALAIEGLEELMKAFLTDAKRRAAEQAEMQREFARMAAAGAGGGSGAGNQSSGPGAIDWNKIMKGKGGLALGATMLAAFAMWLKDFFGDKSWGKKLGLEDASVTIGKLLGGGKGGGWLNAIANSFKGVGLGAIIGLKTGGLLGMVAGAIIGGALFAISGYIGAEGIAKWADGVFKGVARSFGLSTNTTQKNVDDAEAELKKAIEANKPVAAELTKVKEQMADLEKKGQKNSKEYRALIQKRGELELKNMKGEEAIHDAQIKYSEFQSDVLRNKLIALEGEEREAKNQNSRLGRRNKILRDRMHLMSEAKQAIALAEIKQNEELIAQNEKQIKGLQEPLKKAKDDYEKFLEAQRKAGTTGNITDMKNAGKDAVDAVVGVFKDIQALWGGKTADALAKEFKEWQKTTAERRKNRVIFDRAVSNAEAKFNMSIENRLTKMAEMAKKRGEEFDEDAERAKLTKAAALGANAMNDPELKKYYDSGLSGQHRSMESARRQRDKFLGEGGGIDRKWQAMLNQYNKQLEDKGKDPITMDQFKEIMDSAVQKLDKRDLETSDTAARLRTGVKGEAMKEGATKSATIQVNAPTVQNVAQNNGNPGSGGNGTTAIAKSPSGVAQPRAAQKAGNPEYIWP